MKASVFVQHKGYINEHLEPLIEISEADLEASRKRLRYEKKMFGSVILYWACDEEIGRVEFFAHDSSDERGYGGRTFEVIMKDGSVAKVKGPWSSRCSIMNLYFLHSVEVTISTETDKYSGAFLVEKVGKMIPEYKITADLPKLINRQETQYVIALKELSS